MPELPAVALTIAGSDSGGGAGIQADLKTFYAFGVFGTSAVTAITAQDTRGVRGVHVVPADMVRAQIDAVVEDLAPAAVKSGMLATAGLVETVADALEHHALATYVLDPVMVASSGDRLLEREAEEAVARRLVPLAALVTPNTYEAAILTGVRVETTDELREAARVLVERGAGAALVKGGHLEGRNGDEVVDVLWNGERERVWRHRRVRTRHTHGTGCTLSAAVAAALARGMTLPDAVNAAVDYVARAIASAPGLGHGHGPVNHFVVPRLSVEAGDDRGPSGGA